MRADREAVDLAFAYDFSSLRLNTGDGDDANDVFGRAAAGEIVHGAAMPWVMGP